MKMQRIFHYAAAMLLAASSQAQFPQVAQTTLYLHNMHSLDDGVKLIEGFSNTSTSPRAIYNMDLSVYRELNFPTAPAGMEWFSMSYITQTLFDTDPSSIEFLLTAYTVSFDSSAFFVYREDGTLLYGPDPGTLLGGSEGALGGFDPIFMENGAAYMLVRSQTDPLHTRLYQLPGSLPCLDCQGLPTGEMIISGDDMAGSRAFQLFPNPAKHIATLVLGDTEVDTITIRDASGRSVRTQHPGQGRVALLSLNGLAAGQYNVTLESNGIRIAVMPLIVAED